MLRHFSSLFALGNPSEVWPKLVFIKEFGTSTFKLGRFAKKSAHTSYILVRWEMIAAISDDEKKLRSSFESQDSWHFACEILSWHGVSLLILSAFLEADHAPFFINLACFFPQQIF